MEHSFLKAISKTFLAYNTFGARSNKKLLPIHLWFAKVIGNKLGKGYSVRSLGKGGEFIMSGKYYPKTLDISIFKDKNVWRLDITGQENLSKFLLNISFLSQHKKHCPSVVEALRL